jgi:omega-6 fatty acid desaturase (delta-12 desaturase)
MEQVVSPVAHLPTEPGKATAPGELLRIMSPAHRRKLCLRGVLLFALDVTVYSLMLSCICLLPGWWLKGLAIFSAGFVISRLFGLAHDAAHNNLTPSPRLNRWIARWAFFPALTPLTSWMFDHHVRHHAHLRIKDKDTTWPPLSLAEYQARSWLGRWWYRFLRTPLGMGPYWIFEYWLPYMFWPRRSELGRGWRAFRIDRLTVCGFIAGVWALLIGLEQLVGDLDWTEPLSPLWIPVLTIFGPFGVWAMMSGLTDFVTHTHPRVVWFADRSEWSYRDTIRNTPHVIFPFGMNPMFLNFFEHTAHHLDPRIPLYHLPAAQSELEAEFGEELAVERLTPWFFLRLLRTCRLYDFERHCWLDYDGRPTTEPQPLGQRGESRCQ